MMQCSCNWKGSKVVSLCGAHHEFFRRAREMEIAALEGLAEEGAEPPPHKRRPGTTPTTDSIATVAVGAALGAVVWIAEGGSALWRYPLAGFAVFLIVFGLGGLMLKREG
jgi:hypothetical protein